MCSSDQGNGTGNIHDTILLIKIGKQIADESIDE
jgi:hypothetical protein